MRSAERGEAGPEVRGPFTAGAIVLVTLNGPREKFWGAVLELVPAGLSVRGIDLNSFEDFARQLNDGDLVTPAAVFFPMHRVERIEIDARNGDIPSLAERFRTKTGREFAGIVGVASQPDIQVGCTLADARRRLVESTLAQVDKDVARAAALLDIEEEEVRRLVAQPASRRGGDEV